MTYTYEDFKKRLASGNYALSDADMKLAERNPDAAISILNYKDDYNKASTDEARALANMGAENIRRTQGGYTGGVDGSNFYLENPTPSSFDSGTKPAYESKWQDSINDAYGKLSDYGSFSYDREAPVYSDRYAGQRDELLNTITNRPAFEYDYKSDPSYQSYAKQYAREGKRATEDTLAAASAQSGGIASSYALTAANQAGNYYASQLSDKIPELYQNAYERYLKEYQQKQNELSALNTASQIDYDRYLNDLTQYNTDRNFAYQQYTDDYSRLRNQLNDAQALDQLDYTKYRDEVGDYQNDRNFRYQQLLDTISNNQYEDEKAYSRAQDQASFRDYSGLEGYGFNMDAQRAQDKLSDEYSRLQLGSGYADLGDYGGVDRLGIDSSNLRADRQAALEQAALENQLTEKQIANYDKSWADDSYSRQLQLAQLAAAQGDFSKLRALGIDTSAAEAAYAAEVSGTDTGEDEPTASDAAKLYKAIADYSAGKATEEQYDILLNAGIISPYGSDDGKTESAVIPTTAPVKAAYSGAKTIEAKDNAILDLFKNGYVPLDNYNGSYADIQNNVLSRNEWNILKARGVKQKNIADYDTYDEYIADIQKYLSQYYGG